MFGIKKKYIRNIINTNLLKVPVLREFKVITQTTEDVKEEWPQSVLLQRGQECAITYFWNQKTKG